MDESYLKAETLFNAGSTEEALAVLEQILNRDSQNINCLLLRAKVYYRLQKWGDALNDLNRIMEIEPENRMAQNYKSMVMNIISFWNKDNFNP